MTISVVIYVKKDFYLLDALNEKIELLKAAGLIEFWNSQDIDEHFLKTKDSNHPKVLTLKRLLGCFHILAFGHGFSFIIFLIEIISNRCET